MATKTASRPKAGAAGSQNAKRWVSRAVTRTVEAGSSVICAGCEDPVKFKAKIRQHQVICNVYVKGVWTRVEHFHDSCYAAAGHPHGEPQDGATTPPRRGAAMPAAALPTQAPAA